MFLPDVEIGVGSVRVEILDIDRLAMPRLMGDLKGGQHGWRREDTGADS